MARPKRILFVCEGNRHRSPTAEALYSTTAGLKTRSAGTSPLARTEVTEELLDWADVVYVMEASLAKLLTHRFPDQTATKQIHSLDIPDDFQRMQPELIAILTERLTPHLGTPNGQ
jgi:predicted protein tyrosine phosphatase